jgi:hypothetical protein
LLVWGEVDDAVGDHAVEALVIGGQTLDAALAELDVMDAGLFRQPSGFRQLLNREVNTDDPARRPHQISCDQAVHS